MNTILKFNKMMLFLPLLFLLLFVLLIIPPSTSNNSSTSTTSGTTTGGTVVATTDSPVMNNNNTISNVIGSLSNITTTTKKTKVMKKISQQNDIANSTVLVKKSHLSLMNSSRTGCFNTNNNSNNNKEYSYVTNHLRRLQDCPNCYIIRLDGYTSDSQCNYGLIDGMFSDYDLYYEGDLYFTCMYLCCDIKENCCKQGARPIPVPYPVPVPKPKPKPVPVLAPIPVPVPVPQPIPVVAPSPVPVPLSTPGEQPIPQIVATQPIQRAPTSTSSSTSPSIIPTSAVVGIVTGIVAVLALIGFFFIRISYIANNTNDNITKKNIQQANNDRITTTATNTKTSVNIKGNNSTTTIGAAAAVPTTKDDEIVPVALLPNKESVLVPTTITTLHMENKMNTNSYNTNNSTSIVLPNSLQSSTNVVQQQQQHDYVSYINDIDNVSGMTDDFTSNASGYIVRSIAGGTTLSSRPIADNIASVTGSIVSDSITTTYGMKTSNNYYTNNTLLGRHNHENDDASEF